MTKFNRYFSITTFTLAFVSLVITLLDLTIDVSSSLLNFSGYTSQIVFALILIYFIVVIVLSIAKKYDELKSIKYSIINLVTLIITTTTFVITLYSLGKILQNF